MPSIKKRVTGFIRQLSAPSGANSERNDKNQTNSRGKKNNVSPKIASPQSPNPSTHNHPAYSINVSPVQISFPSVVPVNILTECFDTRTILPGLLGPTDTRYWSMKYEVSCSVLSSHTGPPLPPLPPLPPCCSTLCRSQACPHPRSSAGQ